MHGEQSFLVNLVTLLIASGVGGYLFKKWGQPKVLGQILAGVIVGPSILGWAQQTEFIANLAEIGVILLMFMAGLETDLEELKNSFHKSSAIALGGVLLPFFMGLGGMYLFKGDLPLSEAVFVGVILTATSMGISLIMVLSFAIFASELGMAAIIGAYFVGVIISTTLVKHRINHEIEKVGHGFFIPVFFANIGVGIDLGSIVNYIWLALFITLIGIVSKIVGSGIGAKLSGFSKKESVQIGISMIPRAEVALIVSNLGLKAGLIGPDVYTSIIMLVIGTTIVAPLLLKQSEKMKDDVKSMSKESSKLKVSAATVKH